MSPAFPYTYISCPCSDILRQAAPTKRSSQDLDRPQEHKGEDEVEEEEKPFDPRHPRSHFSLFPPEHLLYCEECRNFKCPRCITEEIICSYCPSCLFETASSMVRGEGNRCARNCFDCPICTSQLSVSTTSEATAKEGPWILNCNYCMWTSLDIGIKFDKPTNIRAQLDRIANGGIPKAPSRPAESADPSRKSSLTREPLYASGADMAARSSKDQSISPSAPTAPADANARFAALRSFYKNQITTSAANDPSLPSSAAELAYSSPSSLTRIMNLYAGLPGGFPASKKPKSKSKPMREALTDSEGLSLPSPSHLETATAKLQSQGWINTTSRSQRLFQQGAGVGNPIAKLVDELRPMPALLRTKRSKRCKDCRHILVKPEFKTTSTRYRIKLIALNYVPLVVLKPMSPPTTTTTTTKLIENSLLAPDKPSLWILTMKNPLFDVVKVSLATPAVTPGRHGHRVTLLCPQFEIAANSDIWDDALTSAKSPVGAAAGIGAGEHAAEAGKIFAKGRNWTSFVLEVVPVSVVGGGRDQAQSSKLIRSSTDDNDDNDDDAVSEEWNEDEDVVEIPVRVHLEWRQSDVDDGAPSMARAKIERGEDDDDDDDRRKEKNGPDSGKIREEKDKEENVGEDPAKRELNYWMVLGLGRVG